MTLLLASFIGIAINIWRDTYGGGGPPGSLALQQRDNTFIHLRDGSLIYTRT